MGILINLRDNYFYSATFSRVLYGRQEIILTIKVILFITRVRVINCEVMDIYFFLGNRLKRDFSILLNNVNY